VQVYHLSQEKFAERLGISMATLQTWEQDIKAPQDRMRWQVAEKLELDYDDIIWPTGARGKASALAA
jgi:transcriptional regulator with XRE-family HTH domain